MLGNFSITTANGTGQKTFGNLVGGIYAVTANTPANWKLDKVSCSNGSNPNSINLAAGEAVTCTFDYVYTPTALEPGEEREISARLFLPLINQ